jgi:hypothetical protein
MVAIAAGSRRAVSRAVARSWAGRNETLIAAGVAPTNIRLSGESTAASGTGATAAGSHSAGVSGFFDWLFGIEPSESERSWYETNLSNGRTALSAYLDGTVDAERVRETLESSDALQIDEGGATQDDPRGALATAYVGAARSATGQSESAAGETERVIPLEKEELQVGKRQTEVRHRIRTYVVERPVEEQVNLVDETVVIERRPAEGVPTHSGAFQERDIETVERHEEAVVGKTTKAAEEVVVRTAKKARTETVRDKVRETKVDIDKETDSPGAGSRRN